MYCDLIETLTDKCGEYSLLEIWKYDEARIGALSAQDIVDAVNTVEESPVFGYDTDFTDYLGGIKRYAAFSLSSELENLVFRSGRETLPLPMIYDFQCMSHSASKSPQLIIKAS